MKSRNDESIELKQIREIKTSIDPVKGYIHG
jgi:hypothetical protein